MEEALDLSSDRLLNDDDDKILRVKLNRGYRVQNIKSLLSLLIGFAIQINFLPLLHTKAISMYSW